MKLTCVQKIEGFTLGRKYKLLGCAGEYVELKDDNKNKAVLYEGYFEPVKKRRSLIKRWMKKVS